MISTFSIDYIPILGATNYSLSAVEGLDAPDYRIGAYENPGEDGGTVGSAFYASRVVTLTGTVKGTDYAGYNTARRALAYVCRVRKDTNGFPTATRFTFTTLDGAAFFFDGYVKSIDIEQKYLTWGKYLVTIIVPDPMIYQTTQQSSGQVSRPSGGGAVFPWVFPVIFGAGTGGSASVYNYGNADTWPIFTLRGAGTNPYMYSIERGKSFKLNYTTVNVTDVIVIDMNAKTVVLNGTTNLLSAKDVDSEWFSLLAGVTNTILFNTSSSGDGMTLEVTLYPAFIGI
jgi:hypothetical protein